MGNILLTQEGAEIKLVARKNREEVIRAYLDMYDAAVRLNDSFYMTERAYVHKYSYGDYYPSFVNMSWDEFHAHKILSPISFNTYEALVNRMHKGWPQCVADEEEFQQKDEPRGYGGFKYPKCSSDFLYDKEKWSQWHCYYYRTHPMDIEWPEDSAFLPNMEAVNEIIDKEIYSHLNSEEVKDYLSHAEYHEDGDVTKPLKKDAKVLLFHNVVMRKYPNGRGLEGYCMKVGGTICLVNYYSYEEELSNNERIAAQGSLRKIYSIEKNGVKQYISLDFHKGMFEFHDCHGTHLGEFWFNGHRNADPQADHNLRTIS